jgi:hypothetical protein
MNQSKQIIVSEGSRPFWQTCIAAASYLFSIVLLFMIIRNTYYYPTEKAFMGAAKALSIIVFLLVFGIRYSIIQNIYFDLSGKKYKKEYTVGPVRVGKWVALPNVEYISVFRQGWSKDSDGDGLNVSKGHDYNVNVWHNTSKHFTIYSSVEPEPAFEMARYIAMKLQVDLLDATTPNDFKWIELEKAAEEQTA